MNHGFDQVGHLVDDIVISLHKLGHQIHRCQVFDAADQVGLYIIQAGIKITKDHVADDRGYSGRQRRRHPVNHQTHAAKTTRC